MQTVYLKHNLSSTKMADTTWLDIFYDFTKKELKIDFKNALLAQQYQARNREGRILADNNTSVWIPTPDNILHFRASSSRAGSFVMHFDNAAAASAWCRRVVVARLCGETPPLAARAGERGDTCAYVVREWKTADLRQRLGV